MDPIDLQFIPLAAALFGMMILVWITAQWMLGREVSRKRARMIELARVYRVERPIPPVSMRPHLASGSSQDAVAVTVKEEAKPIETKRDRYEVVKV
jgi:hypothetical protein